MGTIQTIDMSFEPKIFILRKDFEKNRESIEDLRYSDDEDIVRVADFLSVLSDEYMVKFGELEILFCEPEGTGFNLNVRRLLQELDIEYKILN